MICHLQKYTAELLTVAALHSEHNYSFYTSSWTYLQRCGSDSGRNGPSFGCVRSCKHPSTYSYQAADTKPPVGCVRSCKHPSTYSYQTADTKPPVGCVLSCKHPSTYSYQTADTKSPFSQCCIPSLCTVSLHDPMLQYCLRHLPTSDPRTVDLSHL